MDIVFQSGEFINEDSPIWKLLELATSFLAIVAGAYVAVWTFKRGVKAQDERELARLDELEEYIKISISNLYEPIEKQIDSLKQFARKLSKQGNYDHSPETIVSLHTKNIKWISQEEFHKIFVGRKKGNLTVKSDLLRKMNADFDYIDSVDSTLKYDFDFFMTNYTKYENEWNQNIKEISKIKDTMQVRTEQMNITHQGFINPFLNQINIIFNTWVQLPNFTEWHITVPSFLIPLQTLCRASTASMDALLLLNHVNECLYADTNVNALKRFIRKSIVFKARRLRRAEKRLRAVMDQFNKMDKLK